jgi:hypothetical protein
MAQGLFANDRVQGEMTLLFWMQLHCILFARFAKQIELLTNFEPLPYSSLLVPKG